MFTRRTFVQNLTALSLLGVGSSSRVWASDSPTWEYRDLQWPPEIGTRAPVLSAVKFLADGTKILTAGDDHCLHLWDVKTEKLQRSWEAHKDWIRGLAIHPESTHVATISNSGQFKIWNAQTWQAELTQNISESPLTAVEYHPQGTQLAIVGWSEKVFLCNTTDGKIIREFKAHDSDLRAVAFSPDGTLLAAAGRSGTIRVWDITNGSQILETQSHKQRIRALLFSRDSAAVLSAAEDGQVHLTPLSAGFTGFALPRTATRIFSMTLYAENQLATAGSDNHIHLWDLQTRQSLGRLAPHTGTITALDIAGNKMVSTGYDTNIRLWTIPQPVTIATATETHVSHRPGFSWR
jgi:WD40 repeat protein